MHLSWDISWWSRVFSASNCWQSLVLSFSNCWRSSVIFDSIRFICSCKALRSLVRVEFCSRSAGHSAQTVSMPLPTIYSKTFRIFEKNESFVSKARTINRKIKLKFDLITWNKVEIYNLYMECKSISSKRIKSGKYLTKITSSNDSRKKFLLWVYEQKYSI